MPSNRDEGHLLFDIRLNKYSINPDEQKILQKIFNSIKLDVAQAQQITLSLNEFTADAVHGYVALAEKFKQKIKAIEDYNKEIEKSHPWKNFFGFFFKKDPAPLKTALIFINKHTHSRITLNNVDTAANYSRNQDNKHAHKLYSFPNDTNYQFTSKRLLSTLAEKSKKFLFWTYGPIAELKNAFNKKVEHARKERNRLLITENKSRILQTIQTHPDIVLAKFHKDNNVSREGMIQHYELQDAINISTTAHIAQMNEYKSIKTLFNARLTNYENYADKINNDKPIFKFINNAKEIIRVLNDIILQATNALALLSPQQNNLSTDQDLEYFNNIIKICTQDIKAIKAFSGSYTKYMIFSDNYVTREQKQHLYKDDIVTLENPADSLLRIV